MGRPGCGITGGAVEAQTQAMIRGTARHPSRRAAESAWLNPFEVAHVRGEIAGRLLRGRVVLA
jgi:hypothetical protein